MREKDLPIDLTKHKVYSKNAKKCVQNLLHRYYSRHIAAELWEKVQLQYCEYLKDEPALKDLNGVVMNTVSLPSTKVTLMILAVGAVLTIPFLPLRSLIPAAYVNGLEKE